MSGVKSTTVTISSNELARLRNAASKATSLQESNRILNQLLAANERALNDYSNRVTALTTNMNAMRTAMNQQAAAANAQAQQLREQLEQTITNTNRQIQDMATRNEENIRIMQQDFHRGLREVRNDIADTMNENNRRIEDAMNRNNQRIANEMAEMNSALSAVKDRVADIESSLEAAEQDEATLLAMAREYQNTANRLVEEMESHYRPEVLLPGRMAAVKDAFAESASEIRDAEGMRGGVAATARMSARATFTAAMQLYQDLLQAEQQWNLQYQATRQVVEASQAQIEASRAINVAEEGENPVNIDVNHWTHGDLSEIERRVGALSNQLKEPEELTIDALRSIENAALQASRETEETALFAAVAVYCSQDRVDFTADFAELMRESQNLQVVEHSYNAHDQRAAYRVRLKNPNSGLEMIVTQTPELGEDGVLRGQLHIDVVDFGTTNLAEIQRIENEIRGALGQLGIAANTVQTPPGFATKPADASTCIDTQTWEKEPVKDSVVKPVHTTGSNKETTKK